MKSPEAVVLVSWVSLNHRAAPILTALTESDSPLRSRVSRLYLCFRDSAGPDGDPEREALAATRRELDDRLGSRGPVVVSLPWKTTASPTDHHAIRTFAEKALRKVRDECPTAPVTIHLSPGTPAMHAVWLALATTGVIEGPVELIQTADARGRRAGRASVERVRFELDTWLHRYRAAAPRDSGAEDDAHVWDPARVSSPALREALERLRTWAGLRVPVLLMGERGTGKTTLANLLRAMSPFQKEQTTEWPAVVCGQFRSNPQLARSELFGHVRGAFTGATRDRIGLIERAHGDSLFFDEIADIDRDTQRLLMAALEGGSFQRLGDEKVRQSQFRLICATNRPVGELRDHLDQDFFDRIAVFQLDVPPLRQCRPDLPNAWKRVLSAAARTAGASDLDWQPLAVHPRLLEAIATHPLPGNFRDLQRAAFHALAGLSARHPEKEIVAQAIAALGVERPNATRPPSPSALEARLPIPDLRRALDEHERAWLEAALQRASGNKTQAAESLGMPRKTFDHRLRRLRG